MISSNWTAFFITFTLSLAVYAATVAPSIVGGDAGELVAEGCNLGTAHPPGYPVFVVLVYMVTRLGEAYGPSNKSPAFFVNTMCAIFGSCASGLLSSGIYLLIDKRNKNSNAPSSFQSTLDALNTTAAVTAGLLFAFSPITWQYSITAEVFALHILFVAAIVHTAIRYATHQTKKLLFLGAFICGLALTNQHTSILLEIPIILWIMYKSNLLCDRQLLLKTALLFVVGLGPYLTLPYLAIYQPHAGSWGDVTTIRGCIHHFLRKDYGTFQLYSGDDSRAEALLDRVLHWFVDFAGEQSCNNPAIFVFFIVGSTSMLNLPIMTNKRKLAAAKEHNDGGIGRVLVASLAFYVMVFHSLSNLPLSSPLLFGIHQRFWLQPNLLAFLAVGIGMSKLGSSYARRSKRRAQCCMVMMAIAVLHSAHRGFISSEESSNMHFDNYAQSVLGPLPQNSLLLVNWDQQWTSIRYVQECEGFRDDITSINLSMMSYPWWESKHGLYSDINIELPGTHYTPTGGSGFTISEFIQSNYERFGERIFVGGAFNYPDLAYDERYEEVPFGMVRQILLKDEVPNVEEFRRQSEEAWKMVAKNHASGLPDAKRYTESTWEWTIGRMFYDSLTARATYLLDMAVRSEGSGRPLLPSLVEATAWLEMASAHDVQARLSPTVRKNLGLAYMKLVQSKEIGSDSLLPVVQDIFAEVGDESFMRPLDDIWWAEDKGRDCKAWASERWKLIWGEFISMEGAKALPDYEQIKAIYTIVTEKAGKK